MGTEIKTDNEFKGNPLLNIPIVNHDGAVGSGLSDAVARDGVTVRVGVANWKEYEYRPDVYATLAHDGVCLFCLFDVSERHLLVNTLDDNGPVWEDSCVELFVADADGEHYYNFETNAAGVALASRRVNRTECEHFAAEKMNRIIRLSSLPKEKVDRIDEDGIGWRLLVGIPFDLFCCGRPDELRINIYKCGDKTSEPHFLSWAPIDTPAPDFHRPEFFRTVRLL